MMELSRETVAGVIGAVIAVLLQITVAPAITLFEAVPNFIVAFASCAPWPRRPRPGRSCRWFWAFSSTSWAAVLWEGWPLCSCW